MHDDLGFYLFQDLVPHGGVGDVTHHQLYLGVQGWWALGPGMHLGM